LESGSAKLRKRLERIDLLSLGATANEQRPHVGFERHAPIAPRQARAALAQPRPHHHLLDLLGFQLRGFHLQAQGPGNLRKIPRFAPRLEAAADLTEPAHHVGVPPAGRREGIVNVAR
jgi:hypothetical protein